jgi:hypothetical protein
MAAVIKSGCTVRWAPDLLRAARQLNVVGPGAGEPTSSRVHLQASQSSGCACCSSLPAPAVGWAAAPLPRCPSPAAWGCRGALRMARGCRAPRRSPRRRAPYTSPAPCGPAPPPAAPDTPPAPAAAASPPARTGPHMRLAAGDRQHLHCSLAYDIQGQAAGRHVPQRVHESQCCTRTAASSAAVRLARAASCCRWSRYARSDTPSSAAYVHKPETL